MKQLSRWMRVVGILYVLNGVALVGMYLTPAIRGALLDQAVPGADPTHPLAEWGMEIWLMFGFEMLVVGAAVVVASRNAWANRILAYTVLGLELIRGIVDDVVWIAKGYPPGVYVAWMIFHSILILTGVLALRRAHSESRDRALVPA